MADEQHPRRGGGDGPDRPEGPDETREFSPFPEEPPVGPQADATAPLSGPTPPAPDATAPLPPVADPTAPLPTAAGAWAGRAGVRPPDATVRESVPAWETVEEPAGRSWWLPILLGILALLLLGILGIGVWLISGAGDDSGQPVATTAPAPATAASSPSPEPTSAAPTTEQPSPTEEKPEDVTVPSLVGLSSGQAREALDELGLTYRLSYRPSDAREGTVVETDPPAGQEVPEGTQVTLVIATAPPTSAAPTSAIPSRPGVTATG